MIKIHVLGTEELQAKLHALPDEIRQRALAGMAQAAHSSAFTGADKHTKTGALIHSLKMGPFADGWEIGHNLQVARHALFVHWGTRPHTITPRRKKVLRWPSGSGGNTGFVFARFVKHPGYKGDPWLVRAGDAAVSAFDGIVAKIQREI